jgi:hypothetical protein
VLLLMQIEIQFQSLIFLEIFESKIDIHFVDAPLYDGRELPFIYVLLLICV